METQQNNSSLDASEEKLTQTTSTSNRGACHTLMGIGSSINEELGTYFINKPEPGHVWDTLLYNNFCPSCNANVKQNNVFILKTKAFYCINCISDKINYLASEGALDYCKLTSSPSNEKLTEKVTE